MVTGMAARKEVLEVAGREVTVSNPDKVFFPQTGHPKLDLVRYYLSVAEGALRGVAGRPMALKRFVNGVEAESFFQKRAPSSRPPGGGGDALARPDELRVDLDPVPGIGWGQIRDVALVTREVLEAYGLVGWPK